MSSTLHGRVITGLLVCGLVNLTPLPGQSGWPQGPATAANKIQAAPLVVDLDASTGDGRLEVVVPSFDDKLYVYEHDGTLRHAWAIDMGDGTISSPAAGDVNGDGQTDLVVLADDTVSNNAALVIFLANGTRHQVNLAANGSASGKSTPCLIDCRRYQGSNPHPALEIIVRDGNGLVHVVCWNGSGFVKLTDATGSGSMPTCSADEQKDRLGFQQITPSPSAVNISATMTSLVVASTDSKVYRWVLESTPQNNWKNPVLQGTYTVPGTNVAFLGSPVIADLDQDGDREIVAATKDSWVFVWDGNGTGAQLNASWPRQLPQNIVASPAVAPLTGAGDAIIVGCSDWRIYAWFADGTTVPGWPRLTGGQVFASPVVAQVDETPGLEVFAASLDQYLYGWKSDGTPLEGWPKRLNTEFFGAPAVGDLHKAGRMSVVSGGYNGRLFVFDLARKYVPAPAGWPQFRGGPARQGAR